MSKDHNTITCSHGKGLACPVCYDQTHRLDNLNWAHAESQHDLSQCGDACNCMKCRINQDIINMGNEPWDVLKPDLIELASSDEQIDFIYQEYQKNTAAMQEYTWPMVKLYFENTHHIFIDDQVWIDNIYPVLYTIKHLGTSKSSCIAKRAAELGLPCIDMSSMTQAEFEAIPEPVRNRSVIIPRN